MKNDEFDITNEYRGRCTGCNDCKIISGGGWSFYACHHNPHKGKWVAEIKQCPKEQEVHHDQ